MNKSRRTLCRHVGLALCLLMIFTVLPVPVAASETKTDTESKTVRVGWYPDSYHITGENGERSGYGYEYEQAVAAYTGWNYEYIKGDWGELVEKLQNGEIDLMAALSYTDERAETMLFSDLPMGKEKYYQYFVEGEDEKKLVDVLKSDMKLIVSGKSQVFNVTQQKLTRLRVMNLKPGTTVVLIFDADAGNLQILKDNINFLHKEKVVSEVICVIQVRNLEDELIRCCNIRQIKELLGSKSEKEYKTDLIKEKSLAKKLTEKKFDINLLWIMSDTGKYIEIENNAQKIKKKM